MVKFTLNEKSVEVEVDPGTPLLWVLRDTLGMMGTKFGCGVAQCGTCTVHIDGSPMRSCVMPIEAIAGRSITTIEGLSKDNSHPLQKAWVELNVSQCGYCQPGQIMSAAALLAETDNPSDKEIDAAMSGNLCRCGTYPRIREAIKEAAKLGRSA